jgi:hypothetical protein
MYGISLGLLLALTPTQTVFKCTDANGVSTYSAKPCSDDPDQVKEVTVKRVKDGPSDAHAKNFEAMRRSNDWADIQHNAENCVANARARIFGPSNARIASLEAEIAQLNRGIARANNNMAGATYASGLRNQISGLQVAITTERTSADQMFASEQARCDATRQTAEQQHKAQAPPEQ